MIPRISFLALLAMVLTAAGVEKRSAPERVEGVPEFYWALFRGGISEDEVADFRAQLPYESITLERTPCYGACPVYRVTFHRSGKVELHAERNLPLTGDFTGTLDVLSYGRLCYMLDHFGFRTMKDRYDPPIRWTDDTT